ncbi:hypothetical protein [Haloferula sp. A504]|uniref:hypothetical protein n=1 Tax=Haloferula sp. A504 TaxID=3373601 RepID=UPI0037C1A0F4
MILLIDGRRLQQRGVVEHRRVVPVGPVVVFDKLLDECPDFIEVPRRQRNWKDPPTECPQVPIEDDVLDAAPVHQVDPIVSKRPDPALNVQIGETSEEVILASEVVEVGIIPAGYPLIVGKALEVILRVALKRGRKATENAGPKEAVGDVRNIERHLVAADESELFCQEMVEDLKQSDTVAGRSILRYSAEDLLRFNLTIASEIDIQLLR